MTDVLVINCGSSSLKFAVIRVDEGRTLLNGIADRLGSADATLRWNARAPHALHASSGPEQVLAEIHPTLREFDIAAVGHRVVHGGEKFTDSAVLDDANLRQLEACSMLAPLHNPANLAGIAAARSRFVDVVHVAVFDTAFHQTLPATAYLYAIPYELYEQLRVRRYGFHGSSHRYVAREAAHRLGKPLEELELVTAHLGNGASTCAIRRGQSVDTSMGLTPLEGLVMGTRSGDVDPNLHQFLAERMGLSLTEISQLLNHKSGLLGLSGVSNDMRTLLHSTEPRARLAVEVFCYRLAKSILSMCASLSKVDALVFTGGIGEHAAQVRETTLGHLRVLGAEVDAVNNHNHGAQQAGRITTPESRLNALVVPTNEELVIAREAARFAH